MPLGLRAFPAEDAATRLASRLATPAALALVASLALPAPALALPWLLVTLLLALRGVLELGSRPLSWPQACASSAWIGVAVGGAWSVADAFGIQPLGYPPIIVRLTAVHFHYAGFALPLLAAALGPRLGALPSACVVFGVPLVAAGLVATQLGAPTWIEAIPTAIVVFGASNVAWAQARGGPALAFSSASLVLGMGMAASYGAMRAGLLDGPLLADMIVPHGVVNAVGFALVGLAATKPAPVVPLVTLPLFASGRVGAGWFAREGIQTDEPLAGQVDRLDRFGSFDARIVDYYERTAAWELRVRARWTPGFRVAGRAWAALMRRVGQAELPTSPDWERVGLRLVGSSRALPDGWAAGRVYERFHADGRPMFVAFYAVWTAGPRLVVCLPLPWSCLCCALDLAPRGEGLRMHTVPGNGATGIVLATPLGPLPMPIFEELDISPGTEGSLVATQCFRVFHVPCLTLHYVITPVTTGPSTDV